MDILLENALKYKSYSQFNYKFTLDCKLSITVAFMPWAFYHLVGLHKLTDIPQLDIKNNAENSATSVFRNILKGYITHSDIQKSIHYTLIEERLQKFADIDNIINTSKIIIDFDWSKTPGNTSKIMSKYILTKEYTDSYAHLCFCYDKVGSEILFPETFIVQHDGYYINNQEIYNIVNVEQFRIR